MRKDLFSIPESHGCSVYLGMRVIGFWVERELNDEGAGRIIVSNLFLSEIADSSLIMFIRYDIDIEKYNTGTGLSV